ncbi:MAG: hypothetical protein WCL16_00165 [bacterium]
MPLSRAELKPSDRKYFEQFSRWVAPEVHPNIIRDLLSPAEIVLKCRRYRKLLGETRKLAMKPLDPSMDWDQLHGHVFNRIGNASLYYMFTGDLKMVSLAVEGFDVLEACKRPYFTYSTCLGVLDMDLRTAHVAHHMAQMKCCFGEALPAGVRQRMTRLVVKRILEPGLEAERTKKYPWMHNDANWRLILCGGFAIAGMAFADDFPDYRELVEFAIEAMLVCAATGDAAGSWNEGPGYWNYGFGMSTAFMLALRVFTNGKLDLFKHPFFQHTGDFWVFMHPRADEIWNWSDCGKKAGASSALIAFARALQNPMYQHSVLATGLHTSEQLYLFDPGLRAEAPASTALTRFFPAVSVLTWRTGFDNHDTFVGLKAGDLLHYNHHCHVDMGGVVVHAAGRELLAELEGWPYPHEGIKDLKRKGNQPGFYDIENKRWLNQDFDHRMAEGHNGVMLDGGHPEFRLGVKSRFLSRLDEPGIKAAVVDSSAFFTPKASRVRRYVVFLPPDLMLLVDEIVAPEPVRARLLFHYPIAQPPIANPVVVPGPVATPRKRDADLVWDSDSFQITDGPAQLQARMLHPAANDHLIIGHNERRTTYYPPQGLMTRINKYLYIENLYRKPRLVFVTAMQFGDKGFVPAAFELDGRPMETDCFGVRICRHGGKPLRIAFDLARVSIKSA